MAEDITGNEQADPTGNFLPYFGNHHERLPVPTHGRGGPVSFTGHIGKPLSEHLWVDVTERLMASRLLVYTSGQMEWCMGWGSGTCIIRLDEKNLVRSIDWTPYWSLAFQDVWGKAGEKSDGPQYVQELGGCIGNLQALAKVDFR